MWGSLFKFSSICRGYITGKKKTLWIGGSTICAAICNVIVNIIIIPYAGILGASIATMFSYFLMFVIRLYSNKIFSIRKIWFYILLTIQ